MTAPDLSGLLSDEGWLYASSLSTGEGDPGRFHALFGRDSLISALALLPVTPEIARATLRALAARQGTRDDAVTLQAPGKIGHEFRDRPPESFVNAGWPDSGGPFAYYATTDATSWFLVVLDALGDAALSDELASAWRRAGEWLAGALQRGGGFVRHEISSARGGLVHQGWRDSNAPAGPSGGGIVGGDGRTALPELADADTQAVAYAALRALARLDPGAAGWSARADTLRDRITLAFAPEVMAVDRQGKRVTGAGSQLGWLLWAEALNDPRAAAARLCEPDILTPFGLRTLSSRSAAFAAHAYHRGSVWPFDSWLGWGGLRAAGRLAEAEQVRTGVLDAVARLGGAPELYAVSADGDLQEVALSNRRQAWTVAALWALANEWDGRVGAVEAQPPGSSA